MSAWFRASLAGLPAALGRWWRGGATGVMEGFGLVGEWAQLAWGVVLAVRHRRVDWRLTLQQVDLVGLGSLPMAAMTVTFSSMVLSIYTIDQMLEFGMTDYVGMLVGATIFRELGPVLTAIVVASRVGSAYGAEISSMKVTEQIDALRALATDPVEYLVVPRVVAGVLALPALALLASVAGVWGGFLIASANDVAREVYWSSVFRGADVVEFGLGLLKAAVFGGLIALISCHAGLTAGFGSAAVGRATTRAVVLCVLVVHIADFAMALLFA